MFRWLLPCILMLIHGPAWGFELKHTQLQGSDRVWMRWVIRGGSSLDTAGLEGLSHFCIRGLFMGTETRTGTEIRDLLAVLDAGVAVHSGTDANHMDWIVPADTFESFLYLFRDLMTQPAFEPREVETLRGQLISELLANGGLNPSIGTEKGLQSITAVDLRSFHRSHYLSSRMEAEVISPWDEATTRRILEQILDTLP